MCLTAVLCLLQTWTQATNYLQLIGILLGQLFFGFMGDWIGRRTAMLTDVTIILLGVILLVVSNGTTMNVSQPCLANTYILDGLGLLGLVLLPTSRFISHLNYCRVTRRHLSLGPALCRGG